MSDTPEVTEPTKLTETTISGEDIMTVIRAIDPIIDGLPRHLVVAACLGISIAAYREDLVESGNVGDLIPHITTLIATYQPGQAVEPNVDAVPN